MATKQLKIKVTTEGIQKSQQQAKGLTSSYKKVAGSLAAMTAAYLVVTKTAKFFSESVKMAAEQEKIFKKLEVATNLAGKSYDDLSGSLHKYLAELQATTEYGDTETAAVLAQMTQLSGNFDGALKALPIALDLAATGLFNLDTASRYVGMALAGNVEMLGRYIPELKSTVTPQLKLMSATEKTAFAMELLQEKFGGTAQANMDTYAAKVKQLNNYWGDFRELIGDYLIPMLSTVTKGMTGFIKSLTQTSLEKSIEQLKRYGASVEKIQELEVSGMQLALIRVEAQLRKINDEGLTRKQLQEQINERINKQVEIVDKLANNEIDIANAKAEQKKIEEDMAGQYLLNIRNATFGLRKRIALGEKISIGYENQLKASDKLSEKDLNYLSGDKH